MERLNRHLARMFVIVVLLTAALLSSVAAASASPVASAGVPEMSIHTFNITEPPATTPRLFVMKFSAVQTSTGASGSILLYDEAKSVVLFGSIKVLTPIAYGYHFEGCGFAFGGLSGRVCFQGAGQAQPNGAPYDLFSILVVSGGNYSVSGQLKAGSVDAE